MAVISFLLVCSNGSLDYDACSNLGVTAFMLSVVLTITTFIHPRFILLLWSTFAALLLRKALAQQSLFLSI